MQRLEVSGAVRHIYMSLGGKGFKQVLFSRTIMDNVKIIQLMVNI
jgi:hypothetical protein